MGSLYHPPQQKKGGFYCKKHHLRMFSLDYCPICVSERINTKKAKEA